MLCHSCLNSAMMSKPPNFTCRDTHIGRNYPDKIQNHLKFSLCFFLSSPPIFSVFNTSLIISVIMPFCMLAYVSEAANVTEVSTFEARLQSSAELRHVTFPDHFQVP